MTKRVAIVTGGSSGIGKEIAKHLKRNGMQVYALSRRVDQMNDLDDLGITTGYVDVADYDSVDEAIQNIYADAGRIDVLVNNAGFGSFGSVEEVPLKDGEYQFKVNVFGAMKMIQSVLPFMRKQGSGRIINMSSMAGKTGMPLGSWYVGSKFAIEGMSDSIREELKEFGIDVVVIEPGAIESNWSSIAMNKLKESSSDGPYAGASRRLADFFELSYRYASKPMVIARMVDQAAFSAKPKARYSGGYGAKASIMLKRLLPDKAFDALMEQVRIMAQRMVNQEKSQRNQVDPSTETK
ncbi:oxidoreductase [Lentilactobacillus sp. SPB1-3]|uniref:Oxidoreductase n=1 Tax=Lentilactobacillus terminaliae TaxID=3003483 RepID=A0ACD5DEK9_9LACO|nr:oxidoreductase [Lentilactobacillus sp. SPB1-3]MCZ0977478.1 oxidoreductase [Lentilactobacillus sp. SPB1-3]